VKVISDLLWYYFVITHGERCLDLDAPCILRPLMVSFPCVHLHFCRLVWANSDMLGCGVSRCDVVRSLFYTRLSPTCVQLWTSVSASRGAGRCSVQLQSWWQYTRPFICRSRLLL